MTKLPTLDLLQAGKSRLRDRRAYDSVSSFDGNDPSSGDDERYPSSLEPDPEKGALSTQSSPSHVASRRDESFDTSPNLSGAHQPMLASSQGRRRRLQTDFRCYKLPNRIVRYLCFALIASVLLLILSLIRMSYVSTRALESIGRPKPRPLWTEFPFLKRYYGGIRYLVTKAENIPEYPRAVGTEPLPPLDMSGRQTDAFPSSLEFRPYPDYSSSEYKAKHGDVKDCLAETPLSGITSTLRAYSGVPYGFPDPLMGSAEVIGIKNDICFDKFVRYGPYGYGYSVKAGGIGAGLHGDREGLAPLPQPDYRGINWGELQDRCAALNAHRFDTNTSETDPKHAFQKIERESVSVVSSPSSTSSSATNSTSTLSKITRTVFLIRTWADYTYTPEAVLFLRSIITELSLLTHGEYTVHILIHVKDNSIPIFASPTHYADTLGSSIPAEFAHLASLWSEPQMALLYPALHDSLYLNLPVHGVYRSTFLPVQYFMSQHPEYTYLWHWEMDARYTGSWYHLFSQLSSFAAAQPRKGLWERSGRFYFPAVHGSWTDFTHLVRVQTEHGTFNPADRFAAFAASHSSDPAVPAAPAAETPIWGAERPPAVDDQLAPEHDITPPTSYAQDKFSWGVGEEADLITLNPLFDPTGTTWLLRDDLTGYDTSTGEIPRRASIVTTARLSRKLLDLMHAETLLKHHVTFSEMWPATVALHHGLKAVYAPHPVYQDRAWPVAYAEGYFNGGKNGGTGGTKGSPFGVKEDGFLGGTWYYNAGFGGDLIRRWWGGRVDGSGGEEEEEAAMRRPGEIGEEGLGSGEGRMCLPGVLVHPVKEVILPVEGNVGNGDGDG